MKRFGYSWGKILAALALVMATMNVNSTCVHYIYQEPVPEAAKKLSKVK